MGLADEVKVSKYMDKKDIGQGIALTVDHWELEDLAKDGQPEKMKTILYFKGVEKGFVLNVTNAGLAEEATGATTRDELVGKVLQLWFDPSIMFGQERTGGIRVYVQPAAAPNFAPAPNAAENQAKIDAAYPRSIRSEADDTPPTPTDADVPVDLDKPTPY